jgi:hypothetical protein
MYELFAHTQYVTGDITQHRIGNFAGLERAYKCLAHSTVHYTWWVIVDKLSRRVMDSGPKANSMTEDLQFEIISPYTESLRLALREH